MTELLVALGPNWPKSTGLLRIHTSYGLYLGFRAAAAVHEQRFRVWSDPAREPWNTWQRMATFRTEMASLLEDTDGMTDMTSTDDMIDTDGMDGMDQSLAQLAVSSVGRLRNPAAGGVAAVDRPVGASANGQAPTLASPTLASPTLEISVIMPTVHWSGTFERCARRILSLIAAMPTTVEVVFAFERRRPTHPGLA